MVVTVREDMAAAGIGEAGQHVEWQNRICYRHKEARIRALLLANRHTFEGRLWETGEKTTVISRHECPATLSRLRHVQRYVLYNKTPALHI